MKLHTTPGSPSSHKVKAVIHHLKLDVETVNYDFLAGELRSPQYTAINPNGSVPTLVDGELVLWESNAIMQYLADKVPASGLFPDEPQLRADVARWQFWELAHFNRAFGTLAFETYAKVKLNIGAADTTLVGPAMTELARRAAVLEQHLRGRNYVVGNAITIADYSLATFESYRTRTPFDWRPYPNINAYFDRIHALDSWAHTAPNQSDTDRRSKAA
jgi:glutathione S-transferase